MWYLAEATISVKEENKGEEGVRAEITDSRRILDHRHQQNQENAGSVDEKVTSKGIVLREKKVISNKMQILLEISNL